MRACLRVHPPRCRREELRTISPHAVLEFLDLGCVNEEQSIYSRTRKLPSASILKWQDGLATKRRYWTLPEVEESSPIRFEQAVVETEKLISKRRVCV